MIPKQPVVSVLLFRKSRSIALLPLIPLLFPVAALATDVTLAWDANTESNLTGYRVFVRGIGETYDYDRPDWEGANTTCTIYGLDSNKHYYFVVRAHDSLGNESGDSNEVYTGTLPFTSCPLTNGHVDFCLDCGPCGIWEGDCDGDGQCASGLTCAQDVGADYGLPSNYDVCELAVIFPVTLQGTTPEEESVILNVTKPSDATDALLTLTVYDPDFSDEGELFINGKGPVELFGAFGDSANDKRTVTMGFTTPSGWWVDGANALTFRHLSTRGYIIEDGSVRFTDISSFPVTLRGTTPEEKSVILNAAKPSDATGALLTLTVYDPDFSDEGELFINGKGPVELFGAFGDSANDERTVTMTFTTPSGWWVDGANALTFRHLSTRGYIIEDGSVSF